MLLGANIFTLSNPYFLCNKLHRKVEITYVLTHVRFQNFTIWTLSNPMSSRAEVLISNLESDSLVLNFNHCEAQQRAIKN